VSRSSDLGRAIVSACMLACLAAAPATAQYSDYFGKNKVQYREFEWKVYHSPHFDVHYYEAEEALLEKVVSYAESAYDRLSREFDHQIQKPIPLIFYATHSAFEQNNVILNFIPEGVGAFATSARNRMVLPVDLPDAELFQLLMHELTHVFQYSILFQDRLGRNIRSAAAPQWFMEGMASYMAKDESTNDKMYLRDAVVNDRIPSIVQRGVSGFLAYRFGHAAFDYVEERWGEEGFRDFVYEMRNTIGSRTDRALERALRIEPEDFDLDFRRWLRRKYLPQLVETGEPSDFGRPFRDEQGRIDLAISPAASPSGDLVAALAVTRGDLDIVLYDAKKRRLIGNLTKGFTNRYEYIVSQHVTSKARMGRDLAFSPDGNTLAAFVKRERGRSLVLFDVLERRLDRMIDMDVEQQHGPAFSPDGGKVAFSGNRDGRFDIFELDLATGEVVNVTNDAAYDGSPTYSPDGAAIVYSTVWGQDHAQLVRLDRADPAQRLPLSRGEWVDKDATFSPDGEWLVFTSDRTGIDDIFAMELATGRIIQLTDVITGTLMPTVVRGENGTHNVVYAGFWKGRFDLYVSELSQPVGEPETAPLAAEPTLAEPLPAFEPDIRVTIDEGNKDEYGGFKLFLEDGGGSVGVTDDQLLLGFAYLRFTDLLGDKRFNVVLSAVDTFSDFDLTYLDLSHRWYWGARAVDSRDYFAIRDPISGRLFRDQEFRQTLLYAFWGYPLSLFHRVDVGIGGVQQEYLFLRPEVDPDTGETVAVLDERSDEAPLVTFSLTGDSTIGAFGGPIDGRRYRLESQYLYDTDDGGTLDWRTSLDWRQYIEVSRRSNFAIRIFAGMTEGNQPSFFYIGGLDTIRGFDFRSIQGDRVFFGNFEYRFPLVDALVGPFYDFRGIRGRIFLDVGGAWFDQLDQDFDFLADGETRLEDGLSSYGWGITVLFAGLQLNWDFAQVWDFKDADDEGFQSSFWIGTRF
jgi:Tol biopolymer transport system component